MSALTEIYVDNVVRHLPENTRADIAAEITATIDDTVEARLGAGSAAEPRTHGRRRTRSARRTRRSGRAVAGVFELPALHRPEVVPPLPLDTALDPAHRRSDSGPRQRRRHRRHHPRCSDRGTDRQTVGNTSPHCSPPSPSSRSSSASATAVPTTGHCPACPGSRRARGRSMISIVAMSAAGRSAPRRPLGWSSSSRWRRSPSSRRLPALRRPHQPRRDVHQSGPRHGLAARLLGLPRPPGRGRDHQVREWLDATDRVDHRRDHRCGHGRLPHHRPAHPAGPPPRDHERSERRHPTDHHGRSDLDHHDLGPGEHVADVSRPAEPMRTAAVL